MAKKRVKVCINGITENDQIRGPVRYIVELVSHLDASKLEIYLLAGLWQKEIYKSLENKARVIYFDISRGRVRRAIFFFFSVPWILRKYNIGIYHIPDTNPIPACSFKAKVISTIHDLAEYIVPERFGRARSIYRRIVSKAQALGSDLIITVSHASKTDIEDILKIRRDRVEVIYNGTTTFPVNFINAEGVSVKEKYILYVGVLENAKNVDRLVEAYMSLPRHVRDAVHLRLVGRKGNAYQRVAEIVKRNGLEGVVSIEGYMSDRDLGELYRNAYIFAYLSEYEGFGLPVLEAMKYGVPVLTSNKSSLPEVVGDAALVVDTTTVGISNALLQLITNDDVRSRLKQKGIKRAAEYDWERTARATQAIYLRMANNR